MRAAALLYPCACMLCGAATAEHQRGLCPDCRQRAVQQMRRLFCDAPKPIDRLVCAMPYDGAMRHALIAYKFYGRYDYERPLTDFMAEAWEFHGMPLPDAVTCVPISFLHAHRRGFNQSERLAAALARRWDVPFVPTLRRRMFSRRQSKLPAAKRWQNASRSFQPRPNCALDAKRVLLIDDIVTTGATVQACAGLLRQMGAESVWVLAAARAGNLAKSGE